MVRRRAVCASRVIESASSRMMMRYGGTGAPFRVSLVLIVSCANARIFSRTTLMPRSSDAFSSSTRRLNSSGLWGALSEQPPPRLDRASARPSRPWNRASTHP